MAVALSREKLVRIAPEPRTPAKKQAWDAYTGALLSQKGAELLGNAKISHAPVRMAMFMANVLHECGLFTIMRENMNYRAERLCQVWPRWFPSVEFARDYAHQPEKIANYVYGPGTKIGKNLGNVNEGDGWRYRGGGALQTTGRWNYEKFGRRMQNELGEKPELIEDPLISIAAATLEWSSQKLNGYADRFKFKACCNGINRGDPTAAANPIGWADRKQNYYRCIPVFGVELPRGLDPDDMPEEPDLTRSLDDEAALDDVPRGRDTDVPANQDMLEEI